MPPNAQGLTALVMLNILRASIRRSGCDGAERLHVEIEAARLVFAVRDAFHRRPVVHRVPRAGLTDKEFAELRAAIDPEKAMRGCRAAADAGQRHGVSQRR